MIARPAKQAADRMSRSPCMIYGSPPRRRAMTLVELLVVIFIVLTVTALAIPVIAPAMRGRQVREASRLVTAYLAGARSEALRTGRATGVIFERFPGVPEMCINLSRCQVPQLYSGDSLTSTITASKFPTGMAPITHNVVTCADSRWAASTPPTVDSFIQEGDLIRFNYQGHYYRLEFDTGIGAWCIGAMRDIDVPPDGTLDVWIQNSDSTNSPHFTTVAVPYQIFRQPKRTSTPPVQLPAGIVIDLNFSGDDNGPFVSRNNLDAATNKPNDLFVGPLPTLPFPLPSDLSTLSTTEMQALDSLKSVMVIFAPDGSVERIFRTVDTDNTAAQNLVWRADRPTGPIHFLIGQRERVPAELDVTALDEVGMSGVPPADQEDVREEALARYNLFDLENLWITINPRSGQITSTENAAVPDLNDPSTDLVPIANHVRAAAKFALEGQAMGGL